MARASKDMYNIIIPPNQMSRNNYIVFLLCHISPQTMNIYVKIQQVNTMNYFLNPLS